MQIAKPSSMGSAHPSAETRLLRENGADFAQQPRWWVLITFLLLITLLAAGLRLTRLDGPSLWVDELYSVRDAVQLSQGETFGWTKTLSHLPVWVSLQLNGIAPDTLQSHAPEQWQSRGVDAFAIRLGPAILGLLTIPALGLVTAHVFGWRTGLIAAGLLAIAPWHIYWSQAGRFYGMQFLFYNLAFLWYFKGVRETSVRYVVLAMAMMLVATMTQPTALAFGFIAVGDWLITLCRRRPTGLRIGSYVALICGFGIGAAMLWADSRAGGPLKVPMGEPEYFKMAAGSVYFIGASVVAFAGLAGWLLLRNGEPRIAWYLLLGGIVPVIVFTILSYRAYAGTRYVFIALYAWLLLSAIGLDACYRAIRERWGAIAALAPAAALLAPMLVANAAYFTVGHGLHPRYRAAYEYVRTHREAGEPVAANLVGWIGRYYLEEENIHPLDDPSSLSELERPAWVVVTNKGRGRPWEQWGRAGGGLRRRYEVWAQMPIASVSVYRYDADEQQ